MKFDTYVTVLLKCLHFSSSSLHKHYAWLLLGVFFWRIITGNTCKKILCKIRQQIERILRRTWVRRHTYTECRGGKVPDFGRMFLTLKYTDLTQNTYTRSWAVTEIMARGKCGLLVVPCTVPVSGVVTRTLRMSVLQSHSRVKHIPTSLSTDVTVNSEL